MLRDLKNLSNSNNETSLFTVNQNSKKVFDNPSFSSFKENAFITNEDDDESGEDDDDDESDSNDNDDEDNSGVSGDNSRHQYESNQQISDTVMDSGIAYKLNNNNIKLDDLLPAYKRINSDTQRSPNINEITSLTENRMKISNQKMSVQSGDYDDENLLNKVNSRDLVPVDGNSELLDDKIKMIQQQAKINDNERNRSSKNN